VHGLGLETAATEPSALPAIAPDKRVAGGVIPDDADQRARKARDAPASMRLVEQGGAVDVGDRADAAERGEDQEAGDDPYAAVATAVVGDLVVEREIAGHRHRCRDDLRGGEIVG